MKTTVFAIATVAALLAVTSVQAQSRKVRAEVPFPFTVGTATLPGGACEVDGAAHQGLVLIRCTGAGAGVMATTFAKQRTMPLEEGKLVFNKYGNRYFLSQIWVPGYDQGRELIRSRAEREIAKSNAAQVAVVALK